MSLFRKFFGVSNSGSDEGGNDQENDIFSSETVVPLDEKFIFNFKRNGGKFLYCENQEELNNHFENILAENDWFESTALCYESILYGILDENKVQYTAVPNPSFLLASCENLIADEGAILFSSKQIKQNKPNDLPTNIVIFATTKQIISTKSDGLSFIKKKYVTDYPTNITAIKYFKKVVEEDFTQYGSIAKNLYLLLLEDL